MCNSFNVSVSIKLEIISCLLWLFVFCVTESYSQTSQIDSVIVRAEHLLTDSAQLESCALLAASLLSSHPKVLNHDQVSKIYRLVGYANIEMSNYQMGDSLLSLAHSNLLPFSKADTKDVLDLFNKEIYAAKVQGKTDQADVLLQEAFELTKFRNDTTSKLFVALLIQQAITQNNAFQMTAARKTLDRAAALTLALQPYDSVLLSTIWTTSAAVNMLRNEPEETNEELRRILAFCRRHPFKSRDNYHRTLTLLQNSSLNHMLDFNQAIQNLDEMMDLVQKFYPPSHPLMARTLIEYADAYTSIGDIEQTRLYSEQANFILAKLPGRTRLKFNNLSLLALSYYQLKKYDLAKSYYQEAYQLSSNDNHLNPFLDYLPLINISNCLLATNNLDSAKLVLDYLRANSTKRLTRHDFTDREVAYQYGTYYETIKDYENAIIHYSRALNNSEKIYSNNPQRVGADHQKLGHVNLLAGKLDSALWHSNKALTLLEVNEAKNATSINPTNHIYLIPALQNAGVIYFEKYLKELDPQLLDKSAAAFDDAVLFIQQLRRFMNSQITRQNLGELYFDVFSGAIKTAAVRYRLNPTENNLNKIYQLIQSSKAQALLENIHKTKFENFVGIPLKLQDQESNLQNKVALLERLIDQDSYRREKWEAQLFSTNLELQNLLDIFKNEYPSYYQLKYDLGPASIDEIKGKLDHNSSIVEYFIDESLLYTIVINNNEAKLIEKQLTIDLGFAVRDLREGISTYYLSQRKDDDLLNLMTQKYQQNASLLYTTLIEPLGTLPENLIIIPDGILGYIPFEALLTESITGQRSFKRYPYLIHDYNIKYHYSSTLWSQTNKKENHNNKLLAIAPDFSIEGQDEIAEVRQGNLLPLIGNLQEVTFIANLFQGSILIGDKATKKSFSELAPEHGIIHFATHAIVDDEQVDQSYLALSQGSAQTGNEHLYIRDLYNTNLTAELVVLSACETGLGKLKKGEGIISLARGFAYAGANAVVTSLWSVSDKATANLMQLFYSQLKKGSPKDVALRNAKLNFIASQDESLAAPFYWASTIAIGDMKPIKSGTEWYWFVLIGLACLLGWFGWQRLRK